MLICNEILCVSSLNMFFHTDRYCQIQISVHEKQKQKQKITLSWGTLQLQDYSGWHNSELPASLGLPEPLCFPSPDNFEWNVMLKLLITVNLLQEVIEMSLCLHWRLCIYETVFAELRILEDIYFEKSFSSWLCGSCVLFQVEDEWASGLNVL